MMHALLHSDHSSHGVFFDYLSVTLGRFGEFLDEVVLHSIIDTVKLVAILFLTYLLMEFIEHRASDKVRSLMVRSGRIGPAVGGVLGAVPQCGFSAAAANLYTGRVITLGTLIAVFLSTSDEMLPILIAGNINISCILLIILYKCAVGIATGFVLDLVLRLVHLEKKEINIDELCDNDDCHCERGILRSALHHTVSVSLFILLVTVILNAVIFFVGEGALSGSWLSIPVLGHFICALVGLVPNCASSVALTRLVLSGVISAGSMVSGLLSGAGIGLLILFKINKHAKENLVIVAILVTVGVIFGLLADFIGLALV